MIRRPPRSTLFPLHDALPIYGQRRERAERRQLPGRESLLVLPVRGRVPNRRGRIHEFLLVAVDDALRVEQVRELARATLLPRLDRKSTRLNSSHANISYAVFC